jgi:hypothetical protein
LLHELFRRLLERGQIEIRKIILCTFHTSLAWFAGAHDEEAVALRREIDALRGAMRKNTAALEAAEARESRHIRDWHAATQVCRQQNQACCLAPCRPAQQCFLDQAELLLQSKNKKHGMGMPSLRCVKHSLPMFMQPASM